MRAEWLWALPLVLGVTLGQQTSPAPSPFAGTWQANLAKSRLDPSMAFRSIVLEISVADERITMKSEIVDATGRTQRASETFRTDGVETPGTLRAGITLMAKWLGPHVLASIATRDGQVYALVTYQLSTDGNTLTSRSSGTAESVIVYDRLP